jgi:hypothetical protein
MSDPGKAVFLSYATQDAEAARRICEALRASGVEVWFDQSELVGGDAWDQKIRKADQGLRTVRAGHFGEHQCTPRGLLPSRVAHGGRPHA